MPRKARLDVPVAPQHAVVRGIERCAIFRDDTDREDLLKRLRRILRDSQTLRFAWSLMPNHFHLLLRTGLVPISNVMRRLLTGYAGNFNLRHGYAATVLKFEMPIGKVLWGGRFGRTVAARSVPCF
jgi:REP element-mobilizing transposase RayT